MGCWVADCLPERLSVCRSWFASHGMFPFQIPTGLIWAPVAGGETSLEPQQLTKWNRGSLKLCEQARDKRTDCCLFRDLHPSRQPHRSVAWAGHR